MASHFENGIISTSANGDTFISSDITINGNVYWVYSVTGSDSNAGTEEFPFATLAAAITAATANNGDIIIVKSGHSQSVGSSIAVNKAGLKIFGLGSGSSAPNFTCTAAIDCINVSAANVEINNLRFPVGTTAANTARINIDAANVKVEGCQFLCGAQDQNTITITANALYAEIESSTFTVSADGPDAGVLVESASAVGLLIRSCTFDGGSHGWDNEAIYSTFAHLNYVYELVTLTNYAGISHTAAAKGYVSGLIAGDGCHVQV